MFTRVRFIRNFVIGAATLVFSGGACLVCIGVVLNSYNEEKASADKSKLARLVDGEEELTTLSVGQPVRLGDYSYVITRTRTQRNIGSAFSTRRAADDAKFLIVDYKVTNEGKETATVGSDRFEFEDEQGRKFSPSSEVQAALTMQGKQDLFFTELQPGIAKKLSMGFEIPQDVFVGKLHLRERGLFASGQAVVEITLNPKKASR